MIYFVRPLGCAGPIKIGYAKNDVVGRIKQLQTGSHVILELFHTIKGSLLEEKALHSKFAARRLHGEWFEDCSEIRDFIRSTFDDSKKPEEPTREYKLHLLTTDGGLSPEAAEAALKFFEDQVPEMNQERGRLA